MRRLLLVMVLILLVCDIGFSDQRELMERFAARMTDIWVDELKWEKVKSMYIKAVKSVYTDEELQGLIEFFQSDLGKLYTEKSQVMMMKLGQASQQHVHSIMARIHKMEQEMLSELGDK